MAEKSFPYFDVRIEAATAEADFQTILIKIKPSWKQNDIIFERSPISASRGLLNTMIKCYNKNNKMDAMMIRIYNDQQIAWITRNEVQYIKCLGPLDCAPKILASFKNGFCYIYFHGEVLTHSQLKEDTIWRLIATDLAKFHSADTKDGGKEAAENKMEEMITAIWNEYPHELLDPKKNEMFFKTEVPPKEVLKAEGELIMDHFKKFNSPMVLCHNDTRPENIIWNEKEQRIHFVDFEGMKYNFQAYDIAAHFGRFCGLTPPDYNLMPSDEFQMKWLRYYLEKYYTLTGKNPNDIADKDVMTLFVQVKKAHLVMLLFTIVFAVQAVPLIADNQMDMLQFGLISLKEYYKQKDRIWNMTLPE